jgi:membrane-associated phospholipid phosphatase
VGIGVGTSIDVAGGWIVGIGEAGVPSPLEHAARRRTDSAATTNRVTERK